MAYTAHYHIKFEAGQYYHVYNRSVNREPMFRSAENYRYFLRQYDRYLSDFVETFAYCLMGNHFHLLIRIREASELAHLPLNMASVNTHELVSRQFRHFFTSYAKAFNKQEDRTVTLFHTPFKRCLVTSDAYLLRLICYIHANLVKHGFIDDFRDWEWSSYTKMPMPRLSKLPKQTILEWFGGQSSYEEAHKSYIFQEEDEHLFGDE